MSANDVMSLFSPSASDWITTIMTRDGRVFNRRISPGNGMTEMDALVLSIRASNLRDSDVVDQSARRAGDNVLVVSEADDHFQKLMRRFR